MRDTNSSSLEFSPCLTPLCLLKPFLGSSDSVNQISGKIKLGKEVLATLEGHWVRLSRTHTLDDSASDHHHYCSYVTDRSTVDEGSSTDAGSYHLRCSNEGTWRCLEPGWRFSRRTARSSSAIKRRGPWTPSGTRRQTWDRVDWPAAPSLQRSRASLSQKGVCCLVSSWSGTTLLCVCVCHCWLSHRQAVAACDPRHQQQRSNRGHQREVHPGGGSEEVCSREEGQVWGVDPCAVRARPGHGRVALPICWVSEHIQEHTPHLRRSLSLNCTHTPQRCPEKKGNKRNGGENKVLMSRGVQLLCVLWRHLVLMHCNVTC